LYAAHVTSRFAALLTRFDATLTAHLPQVQASLKPGLSDTVLDAFEVKHDRALPEELRQLYLWHDGQQFSQYGLFRTLTFQPFSRLQTYMEDWLSDALLLEAWEEDRGNSPSHPEGYVQSIYMCPWWLAFADSPSAESLCVDLEPDKYGTAGQVLAWGADFDGRYVLAESLSIFVEQLLEQLTRKAVHANTAEDLNTWWQGNETATTDIREIFAGFGAVQGSR